MEIDMDIKGLVSEIKKFDNVKNILVQVPEGLKHKVIDMVDIIEKEGYDVSTSVEPVWGACDIGDFMADAIGADLIVHLGHSKFTNSDFKVIYWPCYYVLEQDLMQDLIDKINAKFIGQKIAIVGTVQYSNIIREIETKVNVDLLKTQSTNLNNVKSQILGCNISTISKIMKEAQSVLYVGDGMFHPGAILFERDVKLYILTPGEEIKEVHQDPKFRFKRALLIEKAKTAKKFGIFVTYKKGQNRIDIARRVKDYLRINGKEAHILVCDQVSYDKILGMGFDALVNTACPRIAYDDYKNYPVPILSATEALSLFNSKAELEIDRMH